MAKAHLSEVRIQTYFLSLAMRYSVLPALRADYMIGAYFFSRARFSGLVARRFVYSISSFVVLLLVRVWMLFALLFWLLRTCLLCSFIVERPMFLVLGLYRILFS